MSFLHPSLLWGMVAVGAPLMIHLLSRRHARRLEWAAMIYLLQASERSRKRIRLQQLLLLLLRCLAILFLVLAVVRPRFATTGLLLDAPVEHVVLLDDSTSMQSVDGGASTWDRARDLLRDYVTGLAEYRPGDRLTVRLTSRPDEPLVEGVPATHQVVDPFLAALHKLEPSYRPAQILHAADLLSRDAAGDYSRELIVLTDLSRSDWIASDESDAGNPVADHLQRLGERFGQIHIVDCGMPAAANLAVTDLQLPDRPVTVGATVNVKTTVTNLGAVSSAAVPLALTVDGNASRQQTIPALMPGKQVELNFQVVFADAGLHVLSASVPGDVLVADNVRDAGLQVTESLQVLLVDGAPGIGTEPGETFFLRRALAPMTRKRNDLLVRSVRHTELTAMDLLDVDLIALCNVPSLSPTAMQQLGGWVQNGGGLLITLGDRTTPDSYEEFASQVPGVFPWHLQRPQSTQTSAAVHLASTQHPALRIFAGKRNPFLHYLRIHRWWPVINGGADHTTISGCLARVRAADGDPLLLENSYGEGRVALLTTAIDQAWSNWVANPSYVVMCQQLARHLARRRNQTRSYAVGETLRQPLAGQGLAPTAEMYHPQGGTPHRLQAEVVSDRGDLCFVYPHTERPGLYRMVSRDRDESTVEIAFPVTLHPAEGSLQPCTDADREQFAGIPKVEILNAVMPDGGWGSAGRADLGRLLLFAAFVFLIGEQVCAWLYGRRRKHLTGAAS